MQEDSLEPGPQYLPPGSDIQAAPRGIIEEPAPVQVIEVRSDTTSPSTGEGSHQIGWRYQVIHSNSAHNTTEVNLYASTMASPSGEEHYTTSQSSCLIPEHANPRISGLRQIKIIQEKYKQGNGTPKVFGLIYLFSYVVMSATKSIIT